MVYYFFFCVLFGSPGYYEIFSANNGRGTLCSSDIGNKWKANVSVAKMNDVHILREMIEIRDGFKECCLLSKEDVSDIIENLTGFFYHVPLYIMMCENKDFIIMYWEMGISLIFAKLSFRTN